MARLLELVGNASATIVRLDARGKTLTRQEVATLPPDADAAPTVLAALRHLLL